MKRIELGALTGGGFGLRISRPDFDVTDPAAPLLFDSAVSPASVIFKGSMPAEGTERIVQNGSLPGYPSSTNTTLRSWATFVFPEPLPFVPFVRVFKRYRIGNDDYYRDEFQQYGGAGCSTSDCSATLTEQYAGSSPSYQDTPTHYFLIMNVPAR